MPNFTKRARLKRRYRFKLREIRIELGYKKMKDLAKFLRMPPPVISRMETGRMIPTLETAAYIAERLGVPLTDMVEVRKPHEED